MLRLTRLYTSMRRTVVSSKRRGGGSYDLRGARVGGERRGRGQVLVRGDGREGSSGRVESTSRSGCAFEQNIVAQRSLNGRRWRARSSYVTHAASGLGRRAGGGRGNGDAPSASGTTATRVFLRDSWDRRGGERGRVRGRSRARRLALRTPRACLSKCREARGRTAALEREGRGDAARVASSSRSSAAVRLRVSCRRDRGGVAAVRDTRDATSTVPATALTVAEEKCVRVRVTAHDLVRTSSCRFRVRARNASGYLDSLGRRAARGKCPRAASDAAPGSG